jgi:hypothetical protein
MPQSKTTDKGLSLKSKYLQPLEEMRRKVRYGDIKRMAEMMNRSFSESYIRKVLDPADIRFSLHVFKAARTYYRKMDEAQAEINTLFN